MDMVTPMIATRNSQTHITAAPQSSRGRRPNFSIPHIPGRVMKTLTIAVAMEMRNAFWMPEFWKKFVPSRSHHREDVLIVRSRGLRKLTIEDEVDTGQLLPRLNEDTRESAEGDLVVAGAEAVHIGALANLLFLLEGGAYILELKLNFRIIDRERREA